MYTNIETTVNTEYIRQGESPSTEKMAINYLHRKHSCINMFQIYHKTLQRGTVFELIGVPQLARHSSKTSITKLTGFPFRYFCLLILNVLLEHTVQL